MTYVLNGCCWLKEYVVSAELDKHLALTTYQTGGQPLEINTVCSWPEEAHGKGGDLTWTIKMQCLTLAWLICICCGSKKGTDCSTCLK